MKRLFTEKGFNVKLSVQNTRGNGVDILAQDSKGDWIYTEVKSTTQNITLETPLELRGDQTNMENFVRTRLRDARDGSGRYSGLSADARRVAGEALANFEASLQNNKRVNAFVTEVRFPLYYMTRQPKIPFSVTFRRWK